MTDKDIFASMRQLADKKPPVANVNPPASSASTTAGMRIDDLLKAGQAAAATPVPADAGQAKKS